MSNTNYSKVRFAIQNLVKECFGFNAYMNLACSSAMHTFSEGVRLGLISMEELNAAREYYGRLWDYVGD